MLQLVLQPCSGLWRPIDLALASFFVFIEKKEKKEKEGEVKEKKVWGLPMWGSCIHASVACAFLHETSQHHAQLRCLPFCFKRGLCQQHLHWGKTQCMLCMLHNLQEKKEKKDKDEKKEKKVERPAACSFAAGCGRVLQRCWRAMEGCCIISFLCRLGCAHILLTMYCTCPTWPNPTKQEKKDKEDKGEKKEKKDKDEKKEKKDKGSSSAAAAAPARPQPRGPPPKALQQAGNKDDYLGGVRGWLFQLWELGLGLGCGSAAGVCFHVYTLIMCMG